MRKIVDWIEHRTGLESAIKHFLYEDIPASSGWHQVLGSVALFSFLVQMVTGILLAFNYAPTPGDAYNSLKYIVTELTGGALIRGLHHWGATVMIIVVVLHMLQVFVYGAYKKPREATWMAGVVLLMVTLAFGLTGYLLPWDNRAYWGTVVTTKIAASAPFVGPYMTRLLGSEEGIGGVTFARFFAVHVLVLPPVAMLLIGFHVYLVRKHGVAPAPDETAPKKKFFPGQVFKDTVAVFVAFCILFGLAVMAKAPLGRLADPTDTSYIPRPEWYFLFLFQTLKFFNGPLEVIGAVVLPGLATAVLFLMPFIDRGPLVRLGKRTFAFLAAGLGVLGWTGLTVAAVVTTPPSPEENTLEVSQNEGDLGWRKLTAEELAGLGYFRQENCKACHPGAGKKGIGPNLAAMAPIHRSVEWMVPHFKQPAQVVPGSAMPPVQLDDAKLKALSRFVLKLTPGDEAAIQSAPQFAVDGAMVYESNHCGACHQINGAGMQVGPPLDSVGARRDRDWLEKHFADPKSVTAGSMMPPYKFNAKDMDAICQYLLALK
jgi:quinol-cytochrome oxidoreductase complex cytochrome b subunit/mono/diheme cytochrome c family protein